MVTFFGCKGDRWPGLTACIPGSALGPMLANEYGRTLPRVKIMVRNEIISVVLCAFQAFRVLAMTLVRPRLNMM